MKETTIYYSAKCVMCGNNSVGITQEESRKWGEICWGNYSYAGRIKQKDICPNCLDKILRFNE